MNISDIRIGDRVRQDMGDLRGLADSIAKNTLLHPVVVMRDGLLVAGHRRLEAVKLLGWTDVPVTVVDVADLLSAERDENAERKDFTPTEAVAIATLIKQQQRVKIEAHRHAHAVVAGKKRAGTLKEEEAASIPPTFGDSEEVAAKAVGMSSASLFRATAVVKAAETDPVRFGDLPLKMDETGNVSGTYREMERRKAEAPDATPESGSKPKPRHEIHGRARYPRLDDEMQRAVETIEGVCSGLRALEVSRLDPQRLVDWSASLKESIGFLGKLLRRMS